MPIYLEYAPKFINNIQTGTTKESEEPAANEDNKD